MYRLIVILVLLTVLFFLLRSALRDLRTRRRQQDVVGGNDEMVQDPACRSYVPRGSAVSSRIGGHTYFFCSTACAKTFEKQLAG